jgi:hypothetical protein
MLAPPRGTPWFSTKRVSRGKPFRGHPSRPCTGPGFLVRRDTPGTDIGSLDGCRTDAASPSIRPHHRYTVSSRAAPCSYHNLPCLQIVHLDDKLKIDRFTVWIPAGMSRGLIYIKGEIFIFNSIIFYLQRCGYPLDTQLTHRALSSRPVEPPANCVDQGGH